MSEFLSFISLISAFGAIFLLGVRVGKGWRPDRDAEFEQWKAALRAEIMGDLATAELREAARDLRRAA